MPTELSGPPPPNRHPLKSTFHSLALSGVFLASVGCHRDAPTAMQMPPPDVTVAPPEQRDLVEREELSTRLDAVESVEIRPRVSGYLAEIRFQAGQRVRKGDVLFVIDSRPFQATLQRAEGDLAQSRARNEWSKRDEQRAANLLAQKTISSEEADQRRTHLQESAGALAAAEAAVASARLNLEYSQVRSPVDGLVSRALVTVGNNISGVDGFTTLLATIVSVDPIYGYSNVDERNFVRLQSLRGQSGLPTNAAGRIEVTLAVPGAGKLSRVGTVESFDNHVDPATGSILLRTVFPNPDGDLLPGLFTRIQLPVSARHPVLLVPEAALGTDQSQRFLLVLSKTNTVEYRTVKPGRAVDGKRVIVEGLKADDLVVVNGGGLARVRPGMPVKPQREAAAAPMNAGAVSDAR